MNIDHILSGYLSVLFLFPLSINLPQFPIFTSLKLDNEMIGLVAENPEVSVSGEQGKYTGQVVINAPLETVWDVLTDYDNFDQFFPNVANSQLIETQGNSKIFEQVYQVKIATFSQQFKVRVAVTETPVQEIEFQQIEGDLKSLQGTWKLQPAANSAQILVTHDVSVVPVDTLTRGLFFPIYKSTFKNTLLALKQEAERR
jgi:ribosome-associated toxin RatA of RatAB toxin-antitoxin module